MFSFSVTCNSLNVTILFTKKMIQINCAFMFVGNCLDMCHVWGVSDHHLYSCNL